MERNTSLVRNTLCILHANICDLALGFGSNSLLTCGYMSVHSLSMKMCWNIVHQGIKFYISILELYVWVCCNTVYKEQKRPLN